MSLEQEVSNGVNAERIQRDVAPYFNMVEVAILDAWKKSPVGDEKGQHELRLMLKLLNDLQANINEAIETGKLAKIQIEQESVINKAKNYIRRVV